MILNDARFFKKSEDYDLIRPWFMNGLVTQNDPIKYKKDRKLLTPAFHFKILEDFLAIFDDQVSTLIQILEDKHGDFQSFNISPYISAMVLDAVFETNFGVKFNVQTSDSLPEFIKNLTEYVSLFFFLN